MREQLKQQLLRYGSGWDLDQLERHFEVNVEAEERQPVHYRLHFRARGLSGLHSEHLLVHDGDFEGSTLQLPADPEPGKERIALVDSIVRSIGRVWVIRDSNGTVAKLDLSGGIASFAGGEAPEARERQGKVVLYWREGQTEPVLAVVVDPDARRIVEVRWHELPGGESRLLRDKEVAFLDAAFRKHGDFGVYGRVTDGFAATAEAFSMSIKASDDGYSVQVVPDGGYGHELGFFVESPAGTIRDVVAAHDEPEPYDDEPEPEGGAPPPELLAD